MIVTYLPSFIRDLKALKKTPIYNTIKQMAFEVIPACNSINQIADLKKLKGYDQSYRIRVGDYRIGLFIENNTVLRRRSMAPRAGLQRRYAIPKKHSGYRLERCLALTLLEELSCGKQSRQNKPRNFPII